MLNKLVSSLRGQVKKMGNSRRVLSVPIRVSFEPSNNTGRLTLQREVLSIAGETKDLSESGVSFVVDFIRLQEHYLVGEGRVLNAELDLPNGQIAMKVIGQRYEQFGEHLSINQYLIGASIVSMTPSDKEIYQEFLKRGHKLIKENIGLFGAETTKS